MSFGSPFRVIKFGLQNFLRNFWLSAATVSVLTLMVISINVLIAMNVLGKMAVSAVESKVDVSAHFKPDVEEDRIQTVKVALLGMQEVRDVEYVTAEENLAKFKRTNGEESDLVQSLKEIDDNPFGATLVIKARDISDYPAVLESLSQPLFANLIEENDFADYEAMISRLNLITTRVEIIMLGLSVLFGFIALLIIMNAIRVSIYTHREEISIMRLVGASSWYIRGPFYVESLVWSLISVGVTMALIYPILSFSQPYIQSFFGTQSASLSAFFTVNFVQVVGLQFAGVALMTLTTTKMATAKYLRV